MKSNGKEEGPVIEIHTTSDNDITLYTRRFKCCISIYRPRWTNSNKNILDVFQTIKGLTTYQEGIFYIRYYPMFKEYNRRCIWYATIFHLSRFIVTVGSITVPALLALQNANDDHLKWLVWTISLAVTIFNGILTLFKIDKKYYFLHTTKSFLEREAWQFIGLSGKYAKTHGDEMTNSHEHQFQYFCESIERIKIKQIEEEYYKANETNTENTVAQGTVSAKTASAALNDYFGAKSSSSVQNDAKTWAENVAERTQEALKSMKRYEGARSPV